MIRLKVCDAPPTLLMVLPLVPSDFINVYVKSLVPWTLSVKMTGQHGYFCIKNIVSVLFS